METFSNFHEITKEKKKEKDLNHKIAFPKC